MRGRLPRGNPGEFLYTENPALGAGGSEAFIAVGEDKKTPFDVEKRCGLATAQRNIKRKSDKWQKAI